MQLLLTAHLAEECGQVVRGTMLPWHLSEIGSLPYLPSFIAEPDCVALDEWKKVAHCDLKS